MLYVWWKDLKVLIFYNEIKCERFFMCFFFIIWLVDIRVWLKDISDNDDDSYIGC